MKKKLCEIGARIHFVKNAVVEIDHMLEELIKEIIDQDPEEMRKIIISLLKEKNELL